MTLTDTMTWKTYSDAFWGPDFRSTAGAGALSKRNTEGKRMCQDFEDYLRKRSKLEADYSKSLAGLTKCFRERELVGVLEAAFDSLKDEITKMSKAHTRVSDALLKQAEELKKFREQQTSVKKALEESLNKAQNAKLSQHSKMLNLQKVYVKKSKERDTAESHHRDISVSHTASQKDEEKARNRAIKADDDAEKADTAYKGAVMFLDECRVHWENEMLHTCQVVQEMDEERIRYLRQELWVSTNHDSKLALDIDQSCENVRDVLEKCDIITDIQSFIDNTATGAEHPEPITYVHYTKLTSGSDSDSTHSGPDPYCTISEAATIGGDNSAAGNNNTTNNNNGAGVGSVMKMASNILTFPRKKTKKSSSSAHDDTS